MSSEPVLSVAGVSKCFPIYERPADRLRQFMLPRLQRAVGCEPRSYYREFWALRNVSFEMSRGHTLGIVGRNGSGKSTLLQIICGTLTPTSGHVETQGRVAALLELGSGFNPEFTGRDNVYLNAAMFGLAKEAVDARFDRIAAFADIGEHLDRPVKTYSSGMFVRLAFAVIAHVDADILVIDEALSVGDAVFTQRCMRFIRGFQQHGSILFVSHDTGAVQSLCDAAVWIDRGRVQAIGSARSVSEHYLRSSLQAVYGADIALSSTGGARAEAAGEVAIRSEGGQPEVRDRGEGTASGLPSPPVLEAGEARPSIDYGARVRIVDNLPASSGFETGHARIHSVSLQRLDGSIPAVLSGGERIRMVIGVQAVQDVDEPVIGFLFRDRLGQDLFGENTFSHRGAAVVRVPAGARLRAEFDFTLPMLPNGQYSVMASVASGDLTSNVQHHYLHDAMIVTVSSSRVRWGLVGIPFERISLDLERD